MRRILSILLVISFSMHVLGFYCYYVVRLMDIRVEMRRQLANVPDDQLDRFVLSVEEYAKHRVGSDEITMHGNMYDVARVVKDPTTNTVTIFALHDEAEDSLLSFLASVMKGIQDDAEPLPSELELLFDLYFLLTVFELGAPVFEKYIGYTAYSSYHYSGYSTVQSPPPWCV